MISRLRNAGLLLATTTFLVACSAQTASSNASTTATDATEARPPTATPAAPADETPDIASKFRKGMPYAELRSAFVDAGWLPVRDLQCEANIGGEARACDVLPETESCSTDGHCLMRFARVDGGQARVDAYGPFEQWNMPGRQAEFAVKSWSFSAEPERTAAVACPAGDFDAFLRAFASDERTRKAFTAPWVRVAELQSDDSGDHARTVLVSGAAYDDFNLVHRDGAFHYVDHAGEVDPAALPVDVRPDGANAYTVRFQYGMSEGNSYRFEQRDGCWRLVGDPEPPSP